MTIAHTPSSENGLRDMSLSNHDERLKKFETVTRILIEIADLDITYTQAAKRMKISRPHLENILNSDFSPSDSIEFLESLLALLKNRFQTLKSKC